MICKLWHRWFYWTFYPYFSYMKDGVIYTLHPGEEAPPDCEVFVSTDFSTTKNYCEKCKKVIL